MRGISTCQNRLPVAGFDPRKGQLVELRFFGGLDAAEVAEVMGMPCSSNNLALLAVDNRFQDRSYQPTGGARSLRFRDFLRLGSDLDGRNRPQLVLR